jgi:hypothetical protein
MFQTPPEALRNTATLEAWRRYNGRAMRPLIFASSLPGVMTASMIPISIALSRAHHLWIAIAVAAAALIGSLAWVVLAFLQVRAYRLAHPFVAPTARGTIAPPRRSRRSLAGPA